MLPALPTVHSCTYDERGSELSDCHISNVLLTRLYVMTHRDMLFITSRYFPLTSCSNDTAVVRVWTLWRIVRWRRRIDVKLIVQHVSTVCQTTVRYITRLLAR